MRWIDNGRHAGLAIDVAAAGTLAAAVGFAVGAGTADTDLACSAATIAFMLTVASLRCLDAGKVGRETLAARPTSIKPTAAARGQVVQFPGAGREPARPSVAYSVRSSRAEAVAPADASQALSDALAELRRSLR